MHRPAPGAAAILHDPANASDEAFVRACYQLLLLREADTEGLHYHIRRLQGTTDPVGARLAMLLDFLRTRECPLSSPFIRFAPPGHYYSPLPAAGEARRGFERERDMTAVEGIDCRTEAQLECLSRFVELYRDQPYRLEPDPALRYRCDNDSFSPGDALSLHFMLRMHRPSRVIEIGSGWSSAVMLDTRERYLDPATNLTFIEPFPDRLNQIMRDVDRTSTRVLVEPVQVCNAELFSHLASGDFLFIDSSHVLKTHSDVAYIYLKLLPRVPAGVFVHIHDIFWPFDYPHTWYEEGRCWNEGFLVRALLMRPTRFDIEYFGDYVSHHFSEHLRSSMPLYSANAGCSIWLRTTAPGLVP